MQCGLVAIETYLGWIVTGKMQSFTKATCMTALTMFAQSEAASNLLELDVIGIQDSHCKKSSDETEMTVRAYFLDTVQVQNGGRYEVGFPRMEWYPPVPRNFNLAKKKLENALLKLAGSTLKADEVLKDWLQTGIIVGSTDVTMG